MRRPASFALILVGMLCVLAGAVVLYARAALLDPPRLAARADAALDRGAVRDVLARELARAILARPDAAALSTAQREAVPAQARAVVRSAPVGAVVRRAARRALRDARAGRSVGVELVGVGSATRAALAARGEGGLAALVPPGLDVRVATLARDDAAVRIVRALDGARRTALALTLLGVVALVAGVAVARRRRAALAGAAIAALAAAVALLVAYMLARSAVAGAAGAGVDADAAGQAFDAVAGGLRTLALAVGATAAVVGLAALALPGSRLSAPRT